MSTFSGQISSISNVECPICFKDLNRIENPILPLKLQETATKCSHVYCKSCFDKHIKTNTDKLATYQEERKSKGANAKLYKPVLTCFECKSQDAETNILCDGADIGAEVSPTYIKLSHKDMAKLGVPMLTKETSMKSTLLKIAAISIAALAILGAILLLVILI